MKWMAFAILVAACGGKSASPCKQAVDHMIDISAADNGRKPDPPMQRILAAAREKMPAICERDKWSSALLDCFNGTHDIAGQIVCEKQFTPEQQRGLAEAFGPQPDPKP